MMHRHAQACTRMHKPATYSQMPLKRLRKTVNVPAEIWPLIQHRIKEEKYRSDSDYFVSLAVFDLYARRKHILTAQLMNEPRDIQDKVFAELRDMFDRPDVKPGSWFEHRIDELINERRIEAEVVTDPNGRVTTINRQFTQMCGYSLAELIGKKPGELLQGAKTEKPIVLEFRRAIKEQRSFECTITNYHKSGAMYRVHIKMEALFKGRKLTGYKARERRVS